MKRTLVLLLPAVLSAATALAQDVTYNFSRDTDFKVYKTYKWVNIGKQLDQLTASQIVSAIDGQMAMKGFKRVETDDAQLLLGCQVATREEQSITSYNSGWGYGGGWGGGGISTAYTDTILVGSFVLDIYDRSQEKLIWRGTATKTINTGAKPDKRQKNIEKGAKKLMKDFPPPVK